ncbi:hypothetical protein MVEG_11544 [Podila verticillata NRRL 6337]|uniref:Uncharacterized protein n=1 Tax=Podila verticillata NRRL 6337 TaxID=1069443 RepID=A0A086TK56_9FUNG|nr:hypothetical protein MVEG_11544 [Podila verticillata NRRL 6337]
MASTTRQDHRLSAADPNSDYSQYLRQQQYQQQYQQQQEQEEASRNPRRPVSMSGLTSTAERIETRPRSHSSHLPPSSSESSQLSSKSSASSTTSSSASSTHEPPPLKGYTLTDTTRPQSSWRPPVNRSKLSMQYTPSDPEDSDDEPLGNTQQKQQQQQQQQQYPQNLSLPHSRFMAGQNVELNGSSSAADSLRGKQRKNRPKAS